MAEFTDIVSAEWLKQQLDGDHKNLVVLDVTWYSDKDGRAQYLEKHIPSASYINPFHSSEHNELFPRNIPDQQQFEGLLQNVGVNQDSHVVLYDAQGQNGFFIAGRARWHLKLHGVENVSILNGGLQKWEALGYPVTADVPSPAKGNFKVKYDEKWRTSFENLEGRQQGDSAQVLDSRPKEKYNAGHVQGAKSLPFSELFQEGVMKSPEELRKAFADSGIDLKKPVITNCTSGMSSCTLALAAQVAGAKDVSVFHGGITEYKAKAAGKLEKS